MRRSTTARVDWAYEQKPYEVIAHGRVNGDKIRVQRWEDGTIDGWNASEGRPATQEQIDTLLNR